MKQKLEIYTCDRCERKDEITLATKYYAWGGIVAMAVNGPFKILNIQAISPPLAFHDVKKDLCPDCMASLEKWWEKKL